MSNTDPEHAMNMPHDEETEAKDRTGEKPMSLKDMVVKVVCSEGFLLLLGLTAIAVDPLFFYVPMMKNNSTCLGLDKPLIIVAVILRTLVDVLHDWSWWSKSGSLKLVEVVKRVRNLLKLQPKISFPAESSKNYKTSSPGGRSSMPAWVINLLKRIKISNIFSPYGRSSTEARVMAIIASLPLPQVAVLAVDLRSHLKAWLKFVVICQFVPRIFRTYPTHEAATSSSEIHAWIGAAFNLLLFVLTSHALGGFWYLRAVERKLDCMKGACERHPGCTVSSIYCKTPNYKDNGFINDTCAIQPTSNATAPFEYGMCSDAIKLNLIGSSNFIDKLANGFWWGIHSLSSMAQNLEFSDYIWDTCFAILVCILGLILFALLIGNFQTYLQSTTLGKLTQQRKQKSYDLQTWAPFTNLPPHLRREVSMCRHSKWLEASEVNLESILINTPLKLKKELKPCFCTKLFHKVEEFKTLDEKIKAELQEQARAVVFQARTNIQQEGYPIYEMIHIVQGKVLAYNNNDVKEGQPAEKLKKDDSFGKELLLRALECPLPKLPLATQTIRSLTKVEAFALSFDDFARVFTNHGRIMEPYKKEWAVSIITAALRKNAARKKREKSSKEGKD